MPRRELTREEKRQADAAMLRSVAGVAVGQVWERVPFLSRDGRRMLLGSSSAMGKRIRIVQVPEGRKRTYRFVHVDPKPGGNGRPDRQSHAFTLIGLARNYVLVEIGEGGDDAVAGGGGDQPREHARGQCTSEGLD